LRAQLTSAPSDAVTMVSPSLVSSPISLLPTISM
jgi:hypothetical protein